MTLSAFASKTHHDRKVFEKIKRNMADNSEIHGNIVRHGSSTIVFVENNIKTPMHRFNSQ